MEKLERIFEKVLKENYQITVIENYIQSLKILHKAVKIFFSHIIESNENVRNTSEQEQKQRLLRLTQASEELKQSFLEVKPALIDELRVALGADLGTLDMDTVNNYIDNANILLQGLQLAINKNKNELSDMTDFINKVSQTIDDSYLRAVRNDPTIELHTLIKLKS